VSVIVDYDGRARRRCPRCGLEIDVARPQRPIGKDSTPAARKAYAGELRRQILWEATCPDCRGWWNAVIRLAASGPESVACEDPWEISPAGLAESRAGLLPRS
jgi:hypothetical protein